MKLIPSLASRPLLAGLVALSLGGCSLLGTTDYSRPALTVPGAWWQETGANQTRSTLPTDQWWQAFNDPALNALIEEAFASNNDLAAAAIKVRQAQLQAGLAADDERPTVSASADASTSKRLDTSASSQRSSSLTGSVSYEVDLWGKLSSTTDAKRWEAQATEADRQATAMSLAGTTANLYWQAIYLKERIRLSQDSIDYAQRTLDLVRTQYAAGASSALELLEAQTSLDTQRAAHTQFLQQQVETQNALAILFNGPPHAFDIERAALPQGVPDIPAGLPASVLERRPDLKASELRLRESLATIDATRASYLPDVTLTGSISTGSEALADILRNPIGTLGAGLALPFLQWNERKLEIKVSEADYALAVTNFRQSVYSAFADVENALSARRQYAAQGELLTSAVDSARRAEAIYETRYRAGAVSLQDWLDAQEKRRSNEESLLENHLNQLNEQVTLYQALGGSTPLPQVTDATITIQ
ncbi:efflux transporter outer membrane subunit [Radicibacter daui]|uniref:efflux transporter outer membrane subunit n=1 Tax=Radicibacter daui TaxID=3064829 RepID=UPI004046CC08